MIALGFTLGLLYVLIGILVLCVLADRYGTRIGTMLGDFLLAQMLALAIWPVTIMVDLVLLRLRPRNRRSAI